MCLSPPPAQTFTQPHFPKGHCFCHEGGPLFAPVLPSSIRVWGLLWGSGSGWARKGVKMGHEMGREWEGWGWRDSVGGIEMKRMEAGTGTEGQGWRGTDGRTVVAGGLGQEEGGRQGKGRAGGLGKRTGAGWQGQEGWEEGQEQAGRDGRIGQESRSRQEVQEHGGGCAVAAGSHLQV